MALDYLPTPNWSVVYGEVPSASKWSQLGTNDNSLATGTGIDNLAILTRHLAAAAVTYAKIDTASVIAGQQAVQALTLLNSWTNYGSGFMNAGYWKDTMGVVHLRGMVRSGSGNIAVLPAGYRPSGVSYYPGVSSSNPGIVSVDASGIIKQDGGSNGYLSLDGVHFKAEG